MMKAVTWSETLLAMYQSTRYHILVDRVHQSVCVSSELLIVVRLNLVCMIRAVMSAPFRSTTYCISHKTPWSESASELYRPSDRRLSAK
jgi:hypothetical protein